MYSIFYCGNCKFQSFIMWVFLELITNLLRFRKRSRQPIYSFEAIDEGSNCLWTCTALAAAARQGHGAIVEFLLSHGADPNVKCCCGATPLWWAARFNRKGVVTRLLDVPGIENIISISYGSQVNDMLLNALPCILCVYWKLPVSCHCLWNFGVLA